MFLLSTINEQDTIHPTNEEGEYCVVPAVFQFSMMMMSHADTRTAHEERDARCYYFYYYLLLRAAKLLLTNYDNKMRVISKQSCYYYPLMCMIYYDTYMADTTTTNKTYIYIMIL